MDNNTVAEFITEFGEVVNFKTEWGGKRFTRAQVAALKNGDQIVLENLVNKSGELYDAIGGLREQKFAGNTYWGFKLEEYELHNDEQSEED